MVLRLGPDVGQTPSGFSLNAHGLGLARCTSDQVPRIFTASPFLTVSRL